jgi:hypothetical protein
MIEAPQPMSCRRGAEVLGASRHSIWRWRMAIIGALKPEPDATLAGIVEADEAHQRESRKGSREWVRHRRDPVNALISRFRAFMQPFCGPASKNLAAYGRWHAARSNADRSYLHALRLLLASSPRANTAC